MRWWDWGLVATILLLVAVVMFTGSCSGGSAEPRPGGAPEPPSGDMEDVCVVRQRVVSVTPTWDVRCRPDVVDAWVHGESRR